MGTTPNLQASAAPRVTAPATSTTTITTHRALRGPAQEYSSVSNGEFYDDNDVERDGLYIDGPNENNGAMTGLVDSEDYDEVGNTAVHRENQSRARGSRGSRQQATTMFPFGTMHRIPLLVIFSSFVVGGLLVYRNHSFDGTFSLLSNLKISKTSVNPKCSDEDKEKVDLATYESRTIHYDSSGLAGLSWNPYDLDIVQENKGILILPSFPKEFYDVKASSTNDEDESSRLSSEYEEMHGFGYIRFPDIAKGTVVFVSEGDLYWAQLPSKFDSQSPVSAIKIATTVGNILYPKINPVYPYLIAYRATYDDRSDVYLLDIRPSGNKREKKQRPVQRLTFVDSEDGISKVVGWHPDGRSLLFTSSSFEVSLRDERVYEIALQQQSDSTFHVLETRPLPLAQAVEGFWTVKPSNKRNLEDSNENSTVVPEIVSNAGTEDSAASIVGLSDAVVSQLDEARNTVSPTQNSTEYSFVSPVVAPDPSGTNIVPADVGPESDTSDSPGATMEMPLISPDDELAIPADAYINNECFYFVRFRQHSHTVRYVGGTAESLWAYCVGEAVAVHITHDYNGTSTSPQVMNFNDQQYLVFASDRTLVDGITWVPSTMNLWSIPLPNREALYGSSEKASTSVLFNLDPSQYIQLTHISCRFNGRSLQEYSVDSITGEIVVRVGADLYFMAPEQVRSIIANPTESSKALLQIIPFHVFSDFREQQERFVKIVTNSHLTAGDFFKTSYGSVGMLLTLRGQVWVVPVVEDYQSFEDNPYEGAGQNIPERRYRVVPGAMTGGAIRVHKALIVPLLTSAAPNDGLFDLADHDNNETVPKYHRTSANHTGTATPKDDERRLALMLATDPKSPTAELGFFLIEIQTDSINNFANLEQLPKPFVGGTVSGGSIRDGGLGTILPDSLTVSPCGRRFAWADTDNRICVMTMPIYIDKDYLNKTKKTRFLDINFDHDTNISEDRKFSFHCLPATNENNEPMAGSMADMKWSPGGRYLAVSHSAKNQFNVITIVDCGSPEPAKDGNFQVTDIKLGRTVQVTPSRFNCYDMYWGISSFDLFLQETLDLDEIPASTLYFLSDRDIVSDVLNPWGTRQPSPHFPRLDGHVYALPFMSTLSANDSSYSENDVLALLGRFGGGAAMEVFADELFKYRERMLAVGSSTTVDDTRFRRLQKVVTSLSRTNKKRRLTRHESNLMIRSLQHSDDSGEDTESPFPQDLDIDFGPVGAMSIARNAYRLSHIPKAKYLSILAQTPDDGSLVLIAQQGQSTEFKDLKYYALDAFPSDVMKLTKIADIVHYGLSTDRKYFYLTSEMGKIRVTHNSASSVSELLGDDDWVLSRANVEGITLSLWPTLEYEQMYNDAWRMHRDYFYDVNMHGVNWTDVHARYKSLVARCAKREELDDVLAQMIAEVGALHSFVYGGEKNSPQLILEPAFLGVGLKRVPEWKGYMITEIPEPDPDFNLIDGNPVYSPLSDQTLRLTGQKGLKVGDVIVAINGESVLQGSHLNMHLRGLAGRGVRLEVLRLKSGNGSDNVTVTEGIPEPVIAVPVNAASVSDLRYTSWEWKTSLKAKDLAAEAGFSVGYVHMQAMDRNGEDAFARGFFPDYDKDALILDVRHNQGGNIDSWIVSVLQRKAWSYFSGRGVQDRNGDIDWNEQFAFRGKIVVLMDEFTASDGEGVSRGISELGLGVLVGMRSWGGGIWGSSANRLVDGGIAAAPQWGVFSEKWGWGGGIEMTGVTPDIIVDNDPFMSFNGVDSQLERAISELKKMIEEDPMPSFKPPNQYPDMSMKTASCEA